MMKRCLIAGLVIALALALAWVPVMAEDVGAMYSITLTRGRFDAESARGMLAYVNQLRTGEDAWYWNEDNTERIELTGLQPLQYDYALERTAMQRAAEMAILFEHLRPDGRSVATAYPEDALGYLGGENIAMGSMSMEEAFVGWSEEDEDYNGQGHRRNMLSDGFVSIGIGCYECNGTRYWVQEFSYMESGYPESLPTIPITIDVAEAYLGELSATNDAVRLDAGSSLPMSAISLMIGNYVDAWFAVPCRVEGLTWSAEDEAVARIVDDRLVGEAAGETGLLGRVGDLEPIVRVPVIVRDAQSSSFNVTLSGSMRLSGTDDDNLTVDIPEVPGAAKYEGTFTMLEESGGIIYTFPRAAHYRLCLQAQDMMRPAHCTVVFTAVDEYDEVLESCEARFVLLPTSGILWLPDDLKAVEEEAFMGSDARCAIIPEGCRTIGSAAFADCGSLRSVRIPASVTSIAQDAFDGCPDGLVICAPVDSAAADFAFDSGFVWFKVD